MDSPHGRDAQDLGGRGHPGAALSDAILEHRGHAAVARGARDCSGFSAGADERADLIARFKDLENAGTAAISSSIATFTTAGLMHDCARLEAEHGVARVCGEGCRGQRTFDLAAITEHTHKPLGND